MEIRIRGNSWGRVNLSCSCHNCIEDIGNKQAYDIEKLPQRDMGELWDTLVGLYAFSQ